MQTTQNRLAAIALSLIFTVTMLVSVNQLATSQPPAGLVAQMAQTAANS